MATTEQQVSGMFGALQASDVVHPGSTDRFRGFGTYQQDTTPRHHLWLERCPTMNELHMARRELARENRLPRHGERLVCSIPWNEETDLALHVLLDELRGKHQWFPSSEQLAWPEVARIEDWSIVGRRA
jgi:hypothetical protein